MSDVDLEDTFSDPLRCPYCGELYAVDAAFRALVRLDVGWHDAAGDLTLYRCARDGVLVIS